MGVCVQWYPTLCDPMDCHPLGSSAHGILFFSGGGGSTGDRTWYSFKAGILEWVAISNSRGSTWPRDQTHISCVSWITGRFLICWVIREAHLTAYEAFFQY